MKYLKYSAYAVQQKQLSPTYRANRYENETECWKRLC